jgi:hypothetical protein
MRTGQEPKHPSNYQITVTGHLDSTWSEWFEEMTIKCQEGGTTILSGYLPDQPALYGLINKLQNMGLTLISVCLVKIDEEGI